MSTEESPLIDLQKVPSSARAAQTRTAKEQVTLNRDCEAIAIPAGTPVTLPAGTQVTITQELGGDYTVLTSWGFMMRIAGRDADALGRQEAAREDAAAAVPFGPEQVWDALRQVYDPEIPVNVVDLGLIYDCQVTPLAPGEHQVDIKMTLTAPGCGMGQVLACDVERKVSQVPQVRQVNVELVFDPPWSREMMSEAAQLELGLL
jgi:probable FeS assembly SUF system protein SufT